MPSHKRKRRFMLNTKLNIFAFGILCPFAVLIVYLIFTIVKFGNSYNQSVNNVTVASTYNIDLKEEIDYTLYRMIIGNISVDELSEKTELGNPYEIIAKAEEVFNSLKGITTGKGNEKRLKNIDRSLGNLEKSITEINENIIERGHYDENQKLLDNNIHVLTELLQEEIQDFIYYEAVNLQEVRLNLQSRQERTVRFSLLLFLLVLIVVSILSMVFARSISKPVARLCDSAKLVGKGDFDTRVESSSGDEIATLTDSFNSMIGQIGELVENIKTEQQNLRNTELKLLQAQINPHFLYNTLDTIIWQAEAGKNEEVVQMVTSLSDFFRTSLSEGRDYITVKEEISHIRSYLKIQRFRYRDILEYEINVPEEFYAYSILKLTLQPLIENALYHGIKNKRGVGKITISAETADGDLIFLVADNGIGMKEEQLGRLIHKVKDKRNNVQESGGFGLANVEERIRLNYGEEYGLDFKSCYGVGTEVMVKIKAQKYQERMQN